MTDYTGPERRRDPINTVLWMKELELRFAQLLTDMNRMHEDNVRLLSRHDKALFGNGQPGVVQDVHDIKSLLSGAKWIIGIGGGLMVMQMAQFLLDLFRGTG